MSKAKKFKGASIAAFGADRSIPLAVWAALGLGLAIRLAYLIFSQKSPFYQPLLLDPEYYHHWAQRILAGDFLGDGVFYGLPVYPYFLALCYKLFSGSLFAVKMIQASLGLVTLFFVYKISERLFSKNVGIIAIFLAAVYGPLFFNEGILIPEALSLPLYAVSFYLAIVFFEIPTLAKGIFLGILLGLAALTKAGVIPFVFIFAGLSLMKEIRSQRRQFFPALAILAAFFLTLAPVTLHNFIYGKDTVFLTSHSGFNFYVGNNPKAEGVFIAPEGTGSNVDAQILDSKLVAEREVGHSLKPSEVSKYWSGKAWDFIKRNPSNFLRLCGKKLLLFFDAREISDVDDYAFCGYFNGMLRFPWLNFAVLGPLFLAGALVCFKSIRYQPIVFAWILSYLAGILLFFVNARYRLPLLSVFFPIAAAGIFEIVKCVKKAAWKRLLIFSLVIGLGVVVTQARLVGKDWAGDYVNAGDAELKMKKYDFAMALYKKSLEIDPHGAKANQAMGVLLTQMGKMGEAKESYERALAEDPDNYQSHNNIGLWYDGQGDLEEAKKHFLKAVDLKPSSAQAHNNLGMVYGKEGESERAIKEFEESLRLNPHNARTYSNLGLVLYRLGKVDEARHAWETALQIDPNFEPAKKAIQLLKN